MVSPWDDFVERCCPEPAFLENDAPAFRAPRVRSGLLEIADCAAHIVDSRYEAYLLTRRRKPHILTRRRVGGRLWKHVGDLSNFTFRLLRRAVEFQAKRLAGGVFEVPDILADQLLCLSGKVFAVADIEAKRIEVAVQESAFSLVEDSERFGLICFQRGNRLRQHSLGFIGIAELAWRLSESR